MIPAGYLRAAPLAVTAFASGPSPLRLPNLAQAPDGRPKLTRRSQAEAWGTVGRGHLDGPASASGQLLGGDHLRLDPRRFGGTDARASCSLSHSLASRRATRTFSRRMGGTGGRPKRTPAALALNWPATMFSRR